MFFCRSYLMNNNKKPLVVVGYSFLLDYIFHQRDDTPKILVPCILLRKTLSTTFPCYDSVLTRSYMYAIVDMDKCIVSKFILTTHTLTNTHFRSFVNEKALWKETTIHVILWIPTYNGGCVHCF